jgi:hypothetical protein
MMKLPFLALCLGLSAAWQNSNSQEHPRQNTSAFVPSGQDAMSIWADSASKVGVISTTMAARVNVAAFITKFVHDGGVQLSRDLSQGRYAASVLHLSNRLNGMALGVWVAAYTTEATGNPYAGWFLGEQASTSYVKTGEVSILQVLKFLENPSWDALFSNPNSALGGNREESQNGKTPQQLANTSVNDPENRSKGQQGADGVGSKPKGLDYDSETHTMKYPAAAAILGDQRGTPQGLLNLEDRGSLLPNRADARQPIVPGPEVMPQPETKSVVARKLSPFEAMMAAVATRNIDEGLKKYPAAAFAMPGFAEAVEELKAKAEELAPQMAAELSTRLAAGDQAAKDFESACRAYGAGSISQESWLNAQKRYDASNGGRR